MKRNVLVFLAWMIFIITPAQTTAETPVTYTEGQIATIILPTVPDASKGKYYRLDRWEEGKIVFEQELHPQARVPYIIVPNEDFCIDLDTIDIEGLSRDLANIEEDIFFVGMYAKKEIGYRNGLVYYLLDTTPDCADEREQHQILVGSLRAFLAVRYSWCYNWEKLEYILHDNATPIDGTKVNGNTSKSILYDLSGRRISAKHQRGVYIEDGKKILK